MRRHTFNSALILVLSITAVFLLQCTCSFAESDKPREGSIQFGAKKKPDIDIKGDIGSFTTVFSDVAEKVVPSVVSVIPTKIDTVVFYKNPFYYFFNQQQQGESNPFDFFFGEPRQRRERQDEPPMEKRERRRKGMGSGVIVSEEGYVLTNSHVVTGADEIEVKLNDQRVFDAKIIGSDSLSDVAVLKIEEEVDDLPVVYMGNSNELRPGDWVVAIGNPFNLTWTVTAGIVSALGRTVSGSNRYEDFIQTDAAINPGNSGGALVNIEGELVGINSMIYTRSGGYMGIGFAIPISMARRVMEDLIYEGRVIRGWIGVTIQPLDQATREALGLEDVQRGVLIGDVFKGEPADKAGIERGDIIIAIDGKSVDSPNDLRNTVARIRPGETVPVEIIRDGKKKKMRIKVAQRDEGDVQQLTRGGGGGTDEEAGRKASEKLGIHVANLTKEIRENYNIESSIQGVVVTDVAGGSIVQRRVREGDVIMEIKVSGKDFVKIESVHDFEKVVKQIKEDMSVMLLLRRGNTTFYASFKM
jgi:serine protease Do